MPLNRPTASPRAAALSAVQPDVALSVVQAQAAMAAALTPVQGVEQVPLRAARGRVLAQPVNSPIAVPAHDNSAMDGYAFLGTALQAGDDTPLKVVATVLAGGIYSGPPLRAGDCVRIMTGAMMPPGLDTVVPQEHCLPGPDGASILIPAGAARPGDNCRRAGEDLCLGQQALAAGRRLRSADLGLLASLGMTEVSAYRRLRVAVFSTGDELAQPGQALLPGQIHDSNRHSLMAALETLGCEVIDLGQAPDDRAALGALLDQGLACGADALLTSGGVSAGDADFTRELLAQRGHVGFWKVAMRPGRPFAFGPLARPQAGLPAWLFALPGNPVAALVSYYVLAREGLLRLAGAVVEPPVTLQARLAAPLRKRPGRAEYPRCRLVRAVDGTWEAQLTASQSSGVLRSLSEADGLLVLAPEQGDLPAGAPVPVWLFDGLC